MFAYVHYLRKWVDMGKSELELSFAWQLDRFEVQKPVGQFRFHPKRKWQFDFAWPEHKLAVEIEGGTYSGGRHTRGKGFEDDCEKYNEALLLGWRVLRFTGKMVNSGEARIVTQEALNVFGPEEDQDQ